jgi:hypothetical protein
LGGGGRGLARGSGKQRLRAGGGKAAGGPGFWGSMRMWVHARTERDQSRDELLCHWEGVAGERGVVGADGAEERGLHRLELLLGVDQEGHVVQTLGGEREGVIEASWRGGCGWGRASECRPSGVCVYVWRASRVRVGRVPPALW